MPTSNVTIHLTAEVKYLTMQQEMISMQTEFALLRKIDSICWSYNEFCRMYKIAAINILKVHYTLVYYEITHNTTIFYKNSFRP